MTQSTKPKDLSSGCVVPMLLAGGLLLSFLVVTFVIFYLFATA